MRSHVVALERYKYCCINVDPRKAAPEWLTKMLGSKENTMANRLAMISAKGIDARKVKELKMVPCMVGDAFSYATRLCKSPSSRAFEQMFAAIRVHMSGCLPV